MRVEDRYGRQINYIDTMNIFGVLKKKKQGNRKLI